jgi:hypothetical protein
VETLEAILKNLINNQEEEKNRKLEFSDRMFSKRVLEVSSLTLKLLESLNFVVIDGEYLFLEKEKIDEEKTNFVIKELRNYVFINLFYKKD